MKDIESLLTVHELKLRKWWLFTYALIFGLSFLPASLICVLAAFTQNPLITLGTILILIFSAFPFFLFYFFCYRKQKTFLLTMQLTLLGMILFSLVFNPRHILIKQMEGNFIQAIAGYSFCVIFFFFCFFLSYRLRQINKIIRCQRKYPDQSQELIQTFRNSMDIVTLSSAFLLAKKQTPHLKYLIAREWSLKKKELQKCTP